MDGITGVFRFGQDGLNNSKPFGSNPLNQPFQRDITREVADYRKAQQAQYQQQAADYRAQIENLNATMQQLEQRLASLKDQQRRAWSLSEKQRFAGQMQATQSELNVTYFDFLNQVQNEINAHLSTLKA